MKTNNTVLSRFGGKKTLLALVAALLVACAAVGGTLAFLQDKTDPITNTFTPAHVASAVVEDEFKGITKENVKVQNIGDVNAYIRAMVIVNWADANGNVLAQQPVKGDDYTDWTPGNGWSEGDDGYYYYSDPVTPNGVTGVLIQRCEPEQGKAPEGYNLQVTILADAIQADGGAASDTNAWNHVFGS